jgi:hypothetical protein
LDGSLPKICPAALSIFSLAAILVGSQDHWTQFWKGAIQEPFHQSLVAIGPVVSEEKIWEIPIKIFFSETICSIRTKC